MKIKLLRNVDYYLGRPICHILTFLFLSNKCFHKKESVIGKKDKILFIKLFGMGTIILALPSILAVKKKYPASSIYFLTFRENIALLNLIGLIPEQNIYTVRKDRISNFIEDITRCLLVLLKQKIDVVIDLEFFSRFTAIFSLLIRSRYRIGFHGFHTEGLKRGNFIDFKINYNHTLHTSKAFFTLLKPLGITRDDYSPSIPRVQPLEGYQKRVRGLIKQENSSCDPQNIDKWVIINPNASDLIELRKWSKIHFVKLLNLLLKKYPLLGIILVGSKGERKSVNALHKHFTSTDHAPRIVNLAGRTSIGDLVDIFHSSSLLISNDSGIAQLATLTDIDSIVLFGPETPDLYSPLSARTRCVYLELDCQPCVTVFNGKRSFCTDNKCLQGIAPGYVLDLASDILLYTEKKVGLLSSKTNDFKQL